MAVQEGIVDKSGSWYSYENERLGQGKEKVKEYLKDNPDVMAELEEKVRAVYSPDEPTEEA